MLDGNVWSWQSCKRYTCERFGCIYNKFCHGVFGWLVASGAGRKTSGPCTQVKSFLT